jgi:predicted phosphohydrolase
MSMDRREFIRRATIGAGVGLVAGAAKAATPPPVAGAAQFSFCVVADPHAAEEAKDGIAQYGGGVEKFRRCLDAMDEMEGVDRPDFVLLAGDIHPWALEGHLDDVPFTIYATPGNHESNRKRREELHALFPDGFRVDGEPSDYYSVVHKGMRIISMCDAGAGGDHVGQLCSEVIVPAGQCEWLEKELSAPDQRAILFAHIPPEPKGNDINMFLSRSDSRWLNQLFRATRPEAAFFGHLHGATREYLIGDTRCFNVRSCCWNFERAPMGFIHVRVHEQGLVMREIETGHYT